jgi:peptidoglycan/xylan/chitin deacetylase (PgdA/CDA1 family)
MEHDCPPFLASYRGMEQGAPMFLDLLAHEGITGTFFCTGDVARRYPASMHRIVADGHELGCHGDTHRRFGAMTEAEAQAEIEASSAVLRGFGEVTSFRAPNLDMPTAYLPLLTARGYDLDSSVGAYKPQKGHPGRPVTVNGMLRLPATTMPSVIRLPRPLRRLALATLRDPVVLFFHPWEFVDVTHEKIPLDCRFATGQPALDSLADAIGWFRRRGASFVTMREIGAAYRRQR